MTNARSQLLVIVLFVAMGAAAWWLLTMLAAQETPGPGNKPVASVSMASPPPEARAPMASAELATQAAVPSAPPSHPGDVPFISRLHEQLLAPDPKEHPNAETPRNLHARLSAERPDPGWAPQTETLLLGAFRRMGLDDETLMQITCRSRLCEVQLASATQELSDKDILEQLKIHGWWEEDLAPRASLSQTDQDGTSVAVIFLERQP
ncbi:MAG TPA: hypothetical protein VIL32_07565 [Steroidobacteraceae bacterium]